MMVKWSIAQERPEIVPLFDPSRNNGKAVHDISYGSATKIIITCINCGLDIQGLACNLARSSLKCKKCILYDRTINALKTNNLEENFPDLAKQWNYDRNTSVPSDFSSGTDVRVWWKCSICNHEWETKICTRTHGGDCPLCAKKIRGTKKRGTCASKNNFVSSFPSVASEWHPTKNNRQSEEFSSFSTFKAWWKCAICEHVWQTAISDRTRGRGCKICKRRKFGDSVVKKAAARNNFASNREDLLEEWDWKKNYRSPEKLSCSSAYKAWWLCSKCGNSWSAKISSRTRDLGSGCPKCRESKGEKAIDRLLLNKKIEFERQKRFPGMKDKLSLVLDFYFELNTRKVAIEYNGSQHYQATRFSKKMSRKQCELNLKSLQRRDRIKRRYCKKHDIKLVVIPYWKFDQIEEILTEVIEKARNGALV